MSLIPSSSRLTGGPETTGGTCSRFLVIPTITITQISSLTRCRCSCLFFAKRVPATRFVNQNHKPNILYFSFCCCDLEMLMNCSYYIFALESISYTNIYSQFRILKTNYDSYISGKITSAYVLKYLDILIYSNSINLQVFKFSMLEMSGNIGKYLFQV